MFSFVLYKIIHSNTVKNLTGNNPDIRGMTGAFRGYLVFFLSLFEDKNPVIHTLVYLILFHIWIIINIWVIINPWSPSFNTGTSPTLQRNKYKSYIEHY